MASWSLVDNNSRVLSALTSDVRDTKPYKTQTCFSFLATADVRMGRIREVLSTKGSTEGVVTWNSKGVTPPPPSASVENSNLFFSVGFESYCNYNITITTGRGGGIQNIDLRLHQ